MEHCSVVLVDRANAREHTFDSVAEASDWFMCEHGLGSLRLIRTADGLWQLWARNELLYDGIRAGYRAMSEIRSETIFRFLKQTSGRFGFDLRIFPKGRSGNELETVWVRDNGF